MQNSERDKMLEILLDGLKENARLEEKRILVNSILPVQKYKLLQWILSENGNLTIELRLNSLLIFLDERTKFFTFVQPTNNQSIIKCILKIIPKYCPNIKSIDFRSLWIMRGNNENVKTFLKKSGQLKSLRVSCYGFMDNCAMNDILLNEDFNQHHSDVQIALRKIELIDGLGLTPLDCGKLLKLLPNLKSFGMYQRISRMFTDQINNNVEDNIVEKLSNITEFCDMGTTLTRLEGFAKVCPKTKKIFLWHPKYKVVENLWKFPLITAIVIFTGDLEFVNELINLLTRIGRQIKILELQFIYGIEIDIRIFRKLCPELVKLEINKRLV